jgi:glycosyltransferase involved in cell wall biosynthesis
LSDILFVHSNFPAQFGFLTEALVARGHRCAAIGSKTARGLPNLPLLRWRASRSSTSGIFPPASRAEASIIHGHAAAHCALDLQKRGFEAEVVIGHPGWGETLFMREIFPRAVQIAYAEYYHAPGGVFGFDPEFSAPSLEGRMHDHARNATLALAYAEADYIVCPTAFQASLLPPALRANVAVIHEGVDTGKIRPDLSASFTLASGRVLDHATPIVTFVNRRFEPLRGFHVFMRALPRLLDEVREAEVLLIGSDERDGYGIAAPEGETWKHNMLRELDGKLDPARLHFTGRLPHDRMLAALSISTAHVFYTYPFALSWSLFEAMATGCLVVASDTMPVREVIRSDVNGILLDFFDSAGLSNALVAACREPDRFLPLRRAARATTVERYDRERHCLPAWLALIDEACRRKRA